MKYLLGFPYFILFILVFVFPQSFWVVKVPFLIWCLSFTCFFYFQGYFLVNSLDFFMYYIFFIIIAIVWILVGLFSNNEIQALIESFRLYVVFMLIYSAFAIYLSQVRSYIVFDLVVMVSMLLIAFFCFYNLAVYFWGIDFLPGWFKEQMYIKAGFHNSYVQMNNINVGMYCFLIPYLVSRIILESNYSSFKLFVLFFSLIAAVLASRRIVLFVTFFSPFLLLLILLYTKHTTNRIRNMVVLFYFIGFLILAAVVIIFLQFYPDRFDGFYERFLGIFSSEGMSVRYEQHKALINGFYQSIIYGSGFGGVADVVRAENRPWTYELTYSKILFNSGLLGVISLSVFFSYFMVLTLNKIKQSSFHKVDISLLVGLISVLLASASNPYLSSFDFLFVLSVIPLILNRKHSSARAE